MKYVCVYVIPVFLLFPKKQAPVANHVLVFMVRGIFSSLNFPLAHFPTKGAKAIDLFDSLWQGIEFLEMNDFKVMFLTSECSSFSHTHCKPVSNLDMELVHNMQVMVQGLIDTFTRCTAQGEEELSTRPQIPFLNLMMLVHREPYTSFLTSHTYSRL